MPTNTTVAAQTQTLDGGGISEIIIAPVGITEITAIIIKRDSKVKHSGRQPQYPNEDNSE